MALKALSALSAWVSASYSRQPAAHPLVDCEKQCSDRLKAISGRRRSRKQLQVREKRGETEQLSVGIGSFGTAYSSRRFLPVSETKTSSNVAECVRNWVKSSP